MRHLTRQSRSQQVQQKVPALRRLSSGFYWRLLELCCRSLSSVVSETVKDNFLLAARRRSPEFYLTLSQQYSLQSISCTQLPPLGDPGAIRQLAALLQKCPQVATTTAAKRKTDCIEKVLHLDEQLSRQALPFGESDEVILSAKAWLAQLLGPAPMDDEIIEQAKHGPGSCVSHPYLRRSCVYKYTDWPYGCSPRVRPLLEKAIRLDERWLGALEDSYRSRNDIPKWSILPVNWLSQCLVDYNYNRVSSVPKDGTKDRPIAIEPMGNVYLQLGLHHAIGSRLSAAGFSIRDQERNRSLARMASLDSAPISPCTIDLSDASDTVSLELVRLLLPPDWFELIYLLRSEYGRFPDGSGWRYAKVSSMGNGYTFALETLVFLGLTMGVSRCFGHVTDRKCISVFGDDIICPRYLAQTLISYLNMAGLKVNNQKSFFTGGLFESCGEDWYYGRNLRPVYIDKEIENIGDLISLHNRLNKWWMNNMGEELPCEVSSFILGYYDGELLLGPVVETTDCWIHCKDMRPGRVRALRRQPRKGRTSEFLLGRLAHNLKYCDSTQGSRFSIVLDDEVVRYRVSWIDTGELQ